MIDRMSEKGIRFVAVGDLDLLPQDVVAILRKAEDDTVSGTALTFALAIGHGGRHEIVQGVQSYAKMLIALPKEQQVEAIATLDENAFRAYVQSSQLPDLDLVIRTG